MLVGVRHGRLYLETLDRTPGGEPLDLGRHPLTQPVDALLGLRANDERYTRHLSTDWINFWPTSWPHPGDALDKRVAREAKRWERDGVPELLLEAARKAERGVLDPKLVGLLERVRYHPGGAPDELPDGAMPVLAGWALVEVMRRTGVHLLTCRSCKRPFLAASASSRPLCERPAPGTSRTCRSVDRYERFATKNPDYRREYRRLWDRNQRGLLDDMTWEMWRGDNGPEGWMRFDDWILSGQPAAELAAKWLREQKGGQG